MLAMGPVFLLVHVGCCQSKMVSAKEERYILLTSDLTPRLLCICDGENLLV